MAKIFPIHMVVNVISGVQTGFPILFLPAYAQEKLLDLSGFPKRVQTQGRKVLYKLPGSL